MAITFAPETLESWSRAQDSDYSLLSNKNLSQKIPSSDWHPGPGNLGLNGLNQLCPTRSSQAACGPGKGFVRPALGFCCSRSILHTENLSLFW